MTEPYEQCTLDQGLAVLKHTAMHFGSFFQSIPEGQEDLYVSAMATLCISNMAQNGPPEALKFFLERSIQDIPRLAKLGQKVQ